MLSESTETLAKICTFQGDIRQRSKLFYLNIETKIDPKGCIAWRYFFIITTKLLSPLRSSWCLKCSLGPLVLTNRKLFIHTHTYKLFLEIQFYPLPFEDSRKELWIEPGSSLSGRIDKHWSCLSPQPSSAAFSCQIECFSSGGRLG